jgi:hypothetical protein
MVATTPGTSYPAGTLSAGTTYYWSVAAMSGSTSSMSPVFSFTTAPAPAGSVPVITSVTPTGGSSTSVTFSIQVSDASGVADLAGIGMLVNGSVTGQSACWFYFDQTARTLSLANNAGTAWTSVAQGSGSLVGNTQCTISGTTIHSIAAGSSATLTLTVAFNSQAFAGTKNVYAYALNKEQVSSGYQLEGTWTVPAALTRRPPALPSLSMPLDPSSSTQAAPVEIAAVLTPQ